MEKSKMPRKTKVLVGAFAMLFLLPGCGLAGVMNLTEIPPRPDTAVESGQVENPVDISADDEENNETAVQKKEPEERLSEETTPEERSPEERSPEERSPEEVPFDPPEELDEEPGFEGPPPPPAVGPPGPGGVGGPGPPPGSLAPVEDGTRRLGEAGEVEFRVEEDGALSLVDARANSGWDSQLGKQDFDEVKVFFIGDGGEWEFEAEIKGGLLEVETKQEIPSAEPGDFEVGDAGEVSFSARDGGIILDDYDAADGWDARVEENDFEAIELKFRKENVEYDFKADFDDGSIEVDIDRKESGPAAS